MSAAAAVIGYMPMPANFVYRETFPHGRPRHKKYDAFWAKHPPMDHVRRAKIFSPFDALAGFDEAIAGKEVLYCRRRQLSDEEKEVLDNKLSMLRAQLFQAKTKQAARPSAGVTCFVPCTDIHNEWYGHGGQYVTITGTVTRIDVIVNRTITIDQQVVRLADVTDITLPSDPPDLIS